MGKAKRFNSYDSNVSEKRKLVRSFGLERQKLSVGSSFRSEPLSPPVAVSTGAGAGTGSGTFSTASLAADQTANIAATDHIEFDTLDEDGGVVLQTGAGQADGIFELSGGKKYQLSSHLRPEFSGATGQLVIAWYDITNAAELGRRAIYETQTHASNNANQPVAEIIVTPTANITVEVRIIAVTALTALANEYCVANIFEIALGGTGSGGGGGGSGGVTFPITPTINDHGNVGTVTEDIDLSTSTGHVHKITLTGNPTLTFSNPPTTGTQIEFEIEFIQDATGGRTVTHPASVVETISISLTASTTTIVTYRTNDGGTAYHAIPALRGSISLSGVSGFANTALSNLVSPVLNTNLDVNSKNFTNYLGWTADTGQSFDVGASGNTWNLPTSDTHVFRVNGVDEFEVKTNDIDVHSNALSQYIGYTGLVGQTAVLSASGMAYTLPTGDTYKYTINGIDEFEIKTNDIDLHGNALSDYIGYTALVGQTVVMDATGETHTVPTGDQYDFKINSVSEFTITSVGVAVNESLTFQNTSADPSAAGEIQLNSTDVKVFSGGSVRNMSDIGAGSPPFDDNQVIIQDEGDNTKTLTFNLSLVNTSAGNLLSWASGAARTHTLSSTTGTLAQNNTTQTWSSVQTFEDGNIKIGDSGASNTVLLAVAGLTADKTATFPNNTGTVAEINLAQTWTGIQTFNSDVVLNEDVQFGTANSDVVTFKSTVAGDSDKILISGGDVIKSSSTTEIGFQVTNGTLTVGTKGTMVMPLDTGLSSASDADTKFGNLAGSYGVADPGSSSMTLFIRQSNGNWASVALTRDALV